ncbi:MAG: hypothetical protein P8M49_12255 [Thalassotalea sp.]|nr:hypothetical protein [Thalassotalea sp.]MDG2394280.1 hypothetical protein [Thalassotalea sp.]
MLKAAVAGLVLSVSGFANVGIIDTNNWEISNIEGEYARTYTNYTTLTPLSDAEIKTFLSDSILGCGSGSWCGVNAISNSSGNWVGFEADDHTLSVDFTSMYSFTDIDFYTSRVISTSINLSFYNDDVYLSDFS